MLEVGSVLDNTYEIRSQIGLGGGGVVYKAYHIRLKKNVVIKLIKQNLIGLINERGEVDILKNLRHMYLPQVYDFVIDGNKVYTVMDYIPGESFYDKLAKRRRFPQKKVLKWSLQLCEALSYLHNRDVPVIHSDIKPANIMLTPDDNICLIDFNVSLLFNNSINVIGQSDGYSPPEQYSIYNTSNRMKCKPVIEETTELLPENKTSKPDTYILKNRNSSDLNLLTSGKEKKLSFVRKPNTSKIDERSDIYSLGATLYHLITGEKPAISTENIVLFKNIDFKINKKLKTIITKAMQKNPNDRFQSIAEMYNELKQINENEFNSRKNIFERLIKK